jgi:uncharacterized membrane protein (DUF373 family)
MQFQSMTKEFVLGIYDIVIDVVIIGLIFLMLIALLFSFANVVTSTYRMIPFLKPSAFEQSDFRVLVENVLDVFIVIELFGTFAGYLRTRHVRLSGLLDVTVVFTLREILVKLYGQKFSAEDMIGLCMIALVMVIARSIAGRFPPKPRADTNQ